MNSFDIASRASPASVSSSCSAEIRLAVVFAIATVSRADTMVTLAKIRHDRTDCERGLLMRILLTTLFVLLLATSLPAQDVKPANPTCPVMEGEPVDPEIFVDHEGKRVWFCCDSCVEDFNADPTAYLSLLPQFGGVASAAAEAPESEVEEHEDHALGALHPMLVHFPVALTMAALFAGLLAFISRRRFAGIAFYCILLAAVLSIPAFLMGEQAEEGLGRLSEARQEMVEAHELWGTISMYTLLGVALVHLIARFKPDARGMWLIAFLFLLGAAAVVSYTGYLGGEVARPGHLDALWEYLRALRS